MILLIEFEVDECLGDLTELAGRLGWEEKRGPYFDTQGGREQGHWPDDDPEPCEAAAIDYITGLGFRVIYGGIAHYSKENKAPHKTE